MALPVPMVQPHRFTNTPAEFKCQTLRECPLPENCALCDTPAACAYYWEEHVEKHPYYNREAECLVVLFLNTRRRIKGHSLIGTGTHDTILIHPMQVFRPACILSSPAIVVMHNHPSGDSSPSEADIKITRDLIRSGQLLKIEVLDHVVMGRAQHTSLKALGYFAW